MLGFLVFSGGSKRYIGKKEAKKHYHNVPNFEAPLKKSFGKNSLIRECRMRSKLHHLYIYNFSLFWGFWPHFAQQNDPKKEIKILNFGT